MEPRNGTNGNGNRWLVIVLSLAAPSMLGAVLGWVTTCNSRLVTHTEKIAVLESQLQDTRHELQRINHQLDKLLEGRK